MKGILALAGVFYLAVVSGCASGPAAVVELDAPSEAAALEATAEEVAATYNGANALPRQERDERIAGWYSKQARRGSTGAQNNLGIMYANGRGVPKNYVVAYAWCDVAASTGHNEARRNRDRIAAHMDERDLSMARELSRDLVRKYATSS